MILFVSGRCDIPAFYSDWFFHRLQEGFVDVRNPFNPHQISRIPLNAQNIDALIFCTKNPLPMLPRLKEITIPYVFHVTLTPYRKDIEPNVPDKRKVLCAIQEISKQIGKERVVLRYDPILISDIYTISYHLHAFEKLAKELSGYIETCVISFVDEYKNTKKNMQAMRMQTMCKEDIHTLAKGIGSIARKYNIQVQTCAEDIDLSMYGISQKACVSKEVMERLLNQPYPLPKAKPPRNCNCLPFVDIGDYNACAHLCKYCYANYDEKQVQERIRLHDPKSTVLLGHVSKEDQIHIRKEKEVRQLQLLHIDDELNQGK